MAYTKRWNSTFYSYNGRTYNVEIWDNNYSGASTLFVVGGNGPEISYSSEDDDKFVGIITSKLTLPFMVEDSTAEAFMDSLRNSYEEQDVYIHVYVDGITTVPLWSGFVLMDLSNSSDKGYPYEEKLTAIDGLALLKELDFVDDNTLIPPYTWSETFLGDAWRTFNHWIRNALIKTGAATTTEGAGEDYKFSTSVNWYNDGMDNAGVSADPLALTYCQTLPMYKIGQNSKYEAKTYYEVIEAFCKVWGMRCIYWQHTFFFIQVGSYKEIESGTLVNPVNIPSRVYDNAGTLISSNNYLGTTNYARYEQDILNKTSPGTGIQSLSGTGIENYPRVHEVLLDFKTVGDHNYFTGFPLLEGSYVANTDYISTMPLGIYTDAADLDGFYIKVYLNFTKNSSYNTKIVINFSIRAREVGTTLWTKMYGVASGVQDWVAYYTPTSANPFLVWNSVQTLTQINETQVIRNGLVQTDAAFIGDWEFELFTFTSVSGATVLWGHGAQSDMSVNPTTAGGASPVGIVSYTDGLSPDSYFCVLLNGSITENGIKTIMRSNNAKDSFKIEVKDLFYGDSETGGAAGALRVIDTGTIPYTVTYTDFVGKWGVGTVSGTSTITTVLGQEILNCNATDSNKISAEYAVSENGKDETDGSGTRPVFLNPIGKLKDDGNTNTYVFNNGVFNLQRDEARGEWYEQTYVSVPQSSALAFSNGPASGAVTIPTTGTNTSAGALIAPIIPTLINLPKVAAFTKAYYEVSDSPLTTISITEIGVALFKIDDVLELFDPITKSIHDITLSTDQGAGDTVLRIDSLAFTVPININSIVRLSSLDCAVQYQRKSRGTIGGMPVTETTLGPITYNEDSEYIIDAEIIIGVDTNYIKILPSDFVANTGGGTTKGLQFNDSGTTGVKPTNNSTILWAFIALPYGKKSSALTIWGNGTKPVDVYNMELGASGTGTSLGTGTVGTELDFDVMEASDSNMMAIKVSTDSTGNRIYGGKITIEDI